MNLNLVFFRYFAKLNLAITLLLLIAGFSILGTIIEQNQTIEYYKLNYIDKLGISNANIHLIFGSAMHEVVQHFLDVMYNVTKLYFCSTAPNFKGC